MQARTPSDLSAMLRHQAVQLPAAAREVAAVLEEFAARLLQPAEAKTAVKEFAALAGHYKGLRDRVVPEVRAEEWISAVERLHKASRSVLRHEGLDHSLVGRVQYFLGSWSRRHVA